MATVTDRQSLDYLWPTCWWLVGHGSVSWPDTDSQRS